MIDFPKIEDFKSFYNCDFGNKAFTEIKKEMFSLWPNTRNEVILNIGYTAPYYSSLSKNNYVLSLTPFIEKKPIIHKNEIIIDGRLLPIKNDFIDKIVVIHFLEYINYVEEFLYEIDRVLINKGKVILIIFKSNSIFSGNKIFNSCNSIKSSQITNIINNKDMNLHVKNISSAIFSHKIKLPNFIYNFCKKYLKQLAKCKIIELEKRTYAFNSLILDLKGNQYKNLVGGSILNCKGNK